METKAIQMMAKRPVVETLRGMDVGAVEYFPLSQYTSVRNAPYYTMRLEKALGWRFGITVEEELMRVKVTREA